MGRHGPGTGKRKLDELVLTGMSHVLPLKYPGPTARTLPSTSHSRLCRRRIGGRHARFSPPRMTPSPPRPPQGWSYPFACCSGFDCREVSAEADQREAGRLCHPGYRRGRRLLRRAAEEFARRRIPLVLGRRRGQFAHHLPVRSAALLLNLPHPDARLSEPSRCAAMAVGGQRPRRDHGDQGKLPLQGDGVRGERSAGKRHAAAPVPSAPSAASLWAYYTPSQFTLTTPEANLSTYRWGSKTIKHHFCAVCGCGTFTETPDWSTGKPDFDNPKISVNARLLRRLRPRTRSRWWSSTARISGRTAFRRDRRIVICDLPLARSGELAPRRRRLFAAIRGTRASEGMRRALSRKRF